MKALITGASSGIGRDIARLLVCRGWDVILVARRADRLMELKKELGSKAQCVRCDVSHKDECLKLHEVLMNQDIEMLVNCAGFGLCGFFTETSLDKEMEMIDTNKMGIMASFTNIMTGNPQRCLMIKSRTISTMM